MKYEFYIITDNESGILSNVCNLFSSRGFSIDTVSVQPLDSEKKFSSITLSLDMPGEKINTVREKLLQMVPIHEIEVYKVERIL